MSLFGHRVEKPHKFGGKNYRYVGFYNSKGDARQKARKERGYGHLARVIKVKNGWEVWTR